MTSVLPVILPSHPLVLQVFSSLKVFRTKFCTHCFCLYHAAYMSHPSLFAHPIFNGWNKNVNFLTTLCRSNCILSPVTFSLSFPEIIFRILFPNTAYRFSSRNVGHQTSFPYRATGYDVATHIYSSQNRYLLTVGSSSQFLSMHWYQPHAT